MLPITAQRRMRLMLGPPPMGSDGIWTTIDPYAFWAQRPSPAMVQLAIDAITRAADLRPAELIARAHAMGSPFASWADMFPGEHYRLLTGLTDIVDPRVIIEIGTYTGAGALSLLERAARDARVVTYDVIPWEEIPGTLLVHEDFEGGRLEQRIGDLSDDGYWRHERELFEQADLVFLDGPKDGVFEPRMLRRLAGLAPKAAFLLVIDDIRFLEMVEAWADLPSPKIDLTSFGHWSGTGLAQIGTPAIALERDR